MILATLPASDYFPPAGDLPVPDGILPAVRAAGRDELLALLCAQAGRDTGLDRESLCRRLKAQEMKSAPSGIGDGVALLHLAAPGLRAPYLLMARLATKIDYDAVDHEPVDLAALLVSPAGDGPLHLQRLARLSRLLRQRDFCTRLRGGATADAVRALFLAQNLETARAA